MRSFGTAVLAGFLLGCLSLSNPVPAQAQKLRDTGYCVLENVRVSKVIYEGKCRITQEATEYTPALITVQLGEAQAFKFACRSNGSCLTGPTDVSMRDRGNGTATFRWEDFRLDVDADRR